MSQIHCTNRRRSGQHLKRRDRDALEYLFNENLKKPKSDQLNQKQLAAHLGWSEATLSRELRRGKVKQLNGELEEYEAYSAYVSQLKVELNWANKGPALKIGHDRSLCEQIEAMLIGEAVEGLERLRYSPEAIVMKLDRVGWPTDLRLCAKTIYNYVADDLFLRVGRKDLPRRGRSPRRPYRRVEKRLRPPECKRISDRPKAGTDRLEAGHWEMDCMESVKGDRSCLLTLVDRKTRDSLIFKLGRQSQEAVVRCINGLERKLGYQAFKERFKSITVDNGSEFLNWKQLEQSVISKGKRTAIYYARAYASWERGSNENLNGFIRYFIPKGTLIRRLGRGAIKKLEQFINHYPRKLLGGLSAKEFTHQKAA